MFEQTTVQAVYNDLTSFYFSLAQSNADKDVAVATVQEALKKLDNIVKIYSFYKKGYITSTECVRRMMHD